MSIYIRLADFPPRWLIAAAIPPGISGFCSPQIGIHLAGTRRCRLGTADRLRLPPFRANFDTSRRVLPDDLAYVLRRPYLLA